jgi:hypothetical protein
MTRPRGRPKGDVETGVITVRLPKAMTAHLDGYIARLASPTGGQTNRNTVVRQMLERALIARPDASRPAVFQDGTHGTAAEHHRQALGPWTQEIYSRGQTLRTRSQTLCQNVRRLRTKSHALCTASRQLRRAPQSLRMQRRGSSQ